MKIVLSLLLDFVYLLLLVLVSPILISRRIKSGKYRNGLREKLLGELPRRNESSECRVWFHAVSVGEVLQLQSVIDSLHRQEPKVKFIITTTTETGFKVASEKFPQCQVAYFPLDFSWSVRNALQRVQPDLVVLVELELWPNFIRTAHQHGIPVALINGRLSEKSFAGYRWLKPFIGHLLNRLKIIAVQTEQYRARFLALGCLPEKLSVTGSIKFDCARMTSDESKTEELRQTFQISDNAPVWVAGSTQDPEEEIILKAYRNALKAVPTCHLIIAPRHPERGDAVANAIQSHGFGIIRRSTDVINNEASRANIGLLDTVGELADCWGLADVAFVGGSLGDRGGQNMIEPTALGIPTCFGPNTKNFRDVVKLLTENQAAQTVHSQTELETFVIDSLSDRTASAAMGTQAQSLVRHQQGATEKTCQLLIELIDLDQQSPKSNAA